MENKRYAIVRVDNNCPFYTELVTTKCWIYKNDKSCFKCKIKKNYGDTKEQLIKKIAQILFRESPHNVLYTNPDKVVNEFFYNDCLKTATKIVEFLGVEE